MLRPPAKRLGLIITLWLAALVLAGLMDAHIAQAARDSGSEAYLHAHQLLRQTLRAPGIFWFTLPVAATVMFLHPTKWRAAVLLLVANGLITVNDLIKWTVGRTRPFKLDDGGLHPFVLHPFRGGLWGMFDVKNLSFPSGDAALAFASAAALSILWPRWRWAFCAVAAIVAAERVLENAHWLSDTIAAAAYAIGGAWVIRRWWWDKRQTIVERTETSGPADRR
jgi:membrane-associated phospholipid phosphatase